MKLPVLFASMLFFGGNRPDKSDLESGTDGLRTTEKSTDRTSEDTAQNNTEDIINSEEIEDDDDEDQGLDDVADVGDGGSGLEDSKYNNKPRFSSIACVRKTLSNIKNFILQTGSSSLTDQSAEHPPTHRHRILPMLSGIVIPFSILLEIPGLTGHWYIITENNITIESRKNTPLLDVWLSISMGCALLANIAIICRFLEKKVRTATLVAIIALSTHDIINIVAVTIFGIIHRFNDGFTYGQSFWFTVCSTLASSLTNIMLIIDFVRTPDFARSSSGLTRKQRSLAIVVMLLLVWIALGGLANSLIMDLDFINGLYFTVVVIETIGFGDIAPESPGARVFCALHAALGILNLALAVGICNDTIIEAFEASYRRHLAAFDERRKAHRERRRARHAAKVAFERQLAAAGLPLYVHRVGHLDGGSRMALKRKHLNIEALNAHQKNAAMQEAKDLLGTGGVKLEKGSTFASQLSFDRNISESLQKEFAVKLTVVWALFLTFWLIGAAIFMATEGWTFGAAMWFCFEAFTTIGFGDQTPQTPAGRSVFVGWALLGVGAMTILISVLSEAYSSRYRKVIQAQSAHALERVEDAVKSDITHEPEPAKRQSHPLLQFGRRSDHACTLRRRRASCPDVPTFRTRGDTHPEPSCQCKSGAEGIQLGRDDVLSSLRQRSPDERGEGGRMSRVDFADPPL